MEKFPFPNFYSEVKHLMNDYKKLSSLKEGQSSVVVGLTADNSIRRRLQDIGLIQGTRVECVQPSPLGDPVAFQIRGAVIALRREDSQHVLVQ